MESPAQNSASLLKESACTADGCRLPFNAANGRSSSEGKRTGQRPDSKSGRDDENTRENGCFQFPSSEFASLQEFLAVDPDLLAVAEKWASLPPAVRAGILAMVNATVPDSAAEHDIPRLASG